MFNTIPNEKFVYYSNFFFTTKNFTICKVNTFFSAKIESIIHSKINNLIIFIRIPVLEYL